MRYEVGLAEVGPAEVGPAEVGLAEVGPAEVGPAEVGPDEPRAAQVGPDVRMLSAPSIPDLRPLPEDGKLFLVGHAVCPACGSLGATLARGCLAADPGSVRLVIIRIIRRFRPNRAHLAPVAINHQPGRAAQTLAMEAGASSQSIRRAGPIDRRGTSAAWPPATACRRAAGIRP